MGFQRFICTPHTVQRYPFAFGISLKYFSVFSFNSLSSFSADFLPIEVVDVYQNVEWFAPKLKNGQFLSVPIDDGEKPRCVYFIKDVSRNSEIILYNDLW